MAAPRIVPAFDEIEDGEARVDVRAEPVPIEELAVKRREEALAQRVTKATDVYWQPYSK